MKTAPPFPASLDMVRAASRENHVDGAGIREVRDSIEALLLDEITNQPRSMQKRIGPSEIGTPCDHCLAAKLAGWQQKPQGIPWASTVGTAIHSLIEDFVWNHQAKNNDLVTPRYFTEQTVTVGQIGGVDITGSIDVLDTVVGATIDWKCVSKTSLSKYKTQGPGPTYRTQAHLYAKGCNDAGIPVNTVSICFLPRTTNNWSEHHWWSEPYNPQVALDALTRANNLQANLSALETISVETRDKWITGLPRDPNCWDCQKYVDAPEQPLISGGIEIDLPKK